jgi:hypothetical protein
MIMAIWKYYRSRFSAAIELKGLCRGRSLVKTWDFGTTPNSFRAAKWVVVKVGMSTLTLTYDHP